VLAKLKFLRGTPLDLFGRSEERKIERALITEYETLVEELMAGLNRDTHALAVEIARIPEEIRGFGHVKLANLAAARVNQEKLLQAFHAPHAIAAE
jgi:indolepyruvate ferredoxin oxidoreductase